MQFFDLKGVTVGGATWLTTEDAGAALERLLDRQLSRGMHEVGGGLILMLNRVADNIEERNGGRWPLSGNTFGTVPDRLSRRSGRGIQSIRDSMKVDMAHAGGFASELSGSISTGTMTVHEEGATITPKKSRYLAIPLRAALNRNGTPQRSGPRQWPNTFVMRTRRGGLMIVQRLHGDRIQPLYLLARKSVIPPRLRMGETIEANLPYFKSKAIAAIEKAFR